MKRGLNIRRTVDFYSFGLSAAEDGVSRLEITGKSFTRETYLPLQGHQEITGQNNYRHDEDLYVVDQPLPHNAMESEETLLQAIIELAPTDRANLAGRFSHVMKTWENLAGDIVGRVPRNCFGRPWVIRAEERFGILLTKSEANHWIVRDLAAVPTVPVMFCHACQTDITHTPAEEITGFHVCGHVFHKTCIYQSLGFHDTVFCPECRRPLE
ncbi:hypothetical protein HA466_0218550 [Hirschfeldia incana]|nr:hypothetical protein HA466_0218550 [Hirschfeldia incana]KAJ0241464.1 hypothetical protein HA466_0218550 [Hirschfeldia incana]